MHYHGFGLAELPAGVAGITSDQIGHLGPERDVVLAPVSGVREALAFTVRDVVADEVQWSDCHSGGFHDPVHIAVVIVSRCPTRGKGSPDKYSTAREDVAVFSPRSTADNSRSPRPPSPS